MCKKVLNLKKINYNGDPPEKCEPKCHDPGTFGDFGKCEQTNKIHVCSVPIPAQKLQANSVQMGVFSQLMPKIDVCYFHRFSWEKLPKIIGHVPWLYQ